MCDNAIIGTRIRANLSNVAIAEVYALVDQHSLAMIFTQTTLIPNEAEPFSIITDHVQENRRHSAKHFCKLNLEGESAQ